MANLFDYITWRGDLTFDQVEFNKIDALLLAHISYSLLDGLLTDDFSSPVTLKKLWRDFKSAPNYEERLKIGYVINKKTPELLSKAAKCKRFKDVKICGLREIYDEDKVEQFAAMTYLVGNRVVVSYRGTDDTLVGWKEDFNIVWQDSIPAQTDALKYMEDVAKAFPFKNFTIIGHSKGGNLAINTAVKCGPKIQKRIDKIYNFDGPGFPQEFFEKPEYLAIEKKLVNIYPELSLVGMIFHHPKNYEIVKSDGFAVLQHDALTWQISGANFDNAKDFADESKFFHKALNEWVEKLSVDQTKQFVTALWEVIMASDAKTLSEMQKNSLRSGAKIIAKLASLDKETKQGVRTVLDLLKNIVMKDTPLGKALRL